MGSIQIGEVAIVVEFDLADSLVVMSIHSGGVTVQAAIKYDEFDALLDEMNRVGALLQIQGMSHE